MFTIMNTVLLCFLLINCLASTSNQNQSLNTAIPEFHIFANEFSKVGNYSRNAQKTPRILIENETDNTMNISFDILKLSKYLIGLQYQPIAVLVDDTFYSHYDALYFTNQLLNVPEVRSEFWLMNFNTSGVTSVIAQSRRNLKEFQNQLAENFDRTRYNNLESNESASFFAILKATQILPEKSGILIFVSRKSLDEDLAQLTLNNLVKKHIKLFVIWSGEYPTKGKEETLLKEVAKTSNGDIFLGNKKTSLENNNKIMTPHEVLLIKKNLFKDELLLLPIDRSIKSVNIVIEGTFAAAHLKLPKGDIVNLMVFSDGVNVATHVPPEYHRINAQFETMTHGVGLWKLYVITNKALTSHTKTYNVTIYAETNLIVSSQIGAQGSRYGAENWKQNEIYVQIDGDVSKIENVTVVDSTGYELQNVPYTIIKRMNVRDGTLPETGHRDDNQKQIKITTSNNITLPNKEFYLKIAGINNKGESFARLSHLSRSIDNRESPSILIEMSTSSTLLATSGSRPKIVFDVTNNNNERAFLIFSCQDEKRLLFDLMPRMAWLNPKQTIQVAIYMVQVSATNSFTNLVTLMIQSTEKTHKSVLLYVSNTPINDNDSPRLDYHFTSNCMEVSYSACQSGTWTIAVTAQDSQSGLLSLTSNPSGLYVPNGYISGTKETITGYYSATCCQPLLDITAIDLNNNKRSYQVDANHAQLSTGSIAAIVLGALLFLVLIIIVVLLIRRCYKKRDSRDLPRYRSQTGTSRF